MLSRENEPEDADVPKVSSSSPKDVVAAVPNVDKCKPEESVGVVDEKSSSSRAQAGSLDNGLLVFGDDLERPPLEVPQIPPLPSKRLALFPIGDVVELLVPPNKLVVLREREEENPLLPVLVPVLLPMIPPPRLLPPLPPLPRPLVDVGGKVVSGLIFCYYYCI